MWLMVLAEEDLEFAVRDKDFETRERIWKRLTYIATTAKVTKSESSRVSAHGVRKR